MTQFYQAFSRISTTSDKRWGEKAWVRGYLHCRSLYHRNVCDVKKIINDQLQVNSLYDYESDRCSPQLMQ